MHLKKKSFNLLTNIFEVGILAITIYKLLSEIDMSTTANSVSTAMAAKPNSVATAQPSTAAAASAQPTAAPTPPPSVIGRLPVSKTITITFVPDWSQEDMKSPLRAASLCVLLGPANTLPQQALWSMEFNLFASDKLPSVVKNKDEEPISKGERALLWYAGKPFPKYKNCIVLSKCRLPNDELKTHSIVLRTHGEERDPNALIWVRKRSGPNRRKDLSYLKVVAGHHYYLNITFAADSTIAQLVGNQSWRPIVYLYAKRQKKGIDEIQSSRLFTNFTTNWAQGIEPNVDERELKLAAEALQREAEEDAEDKAMAKTMAPMLTPTNAIPVSPPTAAVMSVTEVKSRGYMPGEDTRTGASLPTSSQHFIPNSLATAASAGTGTGYFAAPSAASIASNFATKASSYQQALSPMTPHLFPLQTRSDIPVEWPEVEAAINSKPLASIVLPSLESKPFNTDFPLESTVERFVNPEESTLAQAMCAIEGVARSMATDSKTPHSDVAKHLLNCFSAVGQLPGWQHVQNYIHNPQLYIERTKSAQKGDEIAAAAMSRTMIAEGSIDDLQLKGQKLIRRLCQRMDWLLDLQRKANKAFDAEFYVKVIATDRAWAEDANSFMKEAETRVTEMLTKNPQKFHAFRELQRKGVQWPHAPALRKEIERAGFVFRPMMIKRDRCVCETCSVEVSGWRPWHNPWSFHNYAKHPPSFQPGVAVTLQPPTSPFVAQMVTESNMRRGGGTASTSMASTSAASAHSKK
jgi:hypothetical protein